MKVHRIIIYLFSIVGTVQLKTDKRMKKNVETQKTIAYIFPNAHPTVQELLILRHQANTCWHSMRTHPDYTFPFVHQ